MQIEDNLRAGLNPAEARYAALRNFGAMQPMKKSHPERNVVTAVETMAEVLS